MTARYWIILIAIGSVFGASFAFNEVLLKEFGALTISAFRVGLGALGCWVWVIISGKRMALPGRALLGLFVLGAFQFAIPFAIFPFAQAQITSSVAGIANAMTPVLVVVVSHFWPGSERATTLKTLGVIFGVAGTVVLVSGESDAGISDWRFVLLAICGPLSYAIALNVAARFRRLDPVVITTWALTGSALSIAPIALFFDGIPVIGSAESLAKLIILGFGLTTLPFLIMYAALPRIGATNISLVTLVAPVSAMLIGVLILEEPTGPTQFVGVSLILLGLVTIDGRLIQRATRAFRPAKPISQV